MTGRIRFLELAAAVDRGVYALFDEWAIETILDMIAKNPFYFPERPPYP